MVSFSCRKNNISWCFVLSLLLFCKIAVAQGGTERIKAVDSEADDPEAKIGGGPCDYKEYKGKATIFSIRKKKAAKGYGGKSIDGYDVKFSFVPFGEIKESHGKVEGKLYSLKLTNSWYPGSKFLEKYNIKEGKIFDCTIKVITKGTCTPILFDFPEITLSDYFEFKQ